MVEYHRSGRWQNNNNNNDEKRNQPLFTNLCAVCICIVCVICWPVLSMPNIAFELVAFSWQTKNINEYPYRFFLFSAPPFRGCRYVLPQYFLNNNNYRFRHYDCYIHIHTQNGSVVRLLFFIRPVHIYIQRIHINKLYFVSTVNVYAHDGRWLPHPNPPTEK